MRRVGCRRRAPALALVFAGTLAPSAIARAQLVEGEGRLSSGWDSNPLFSADPGQRGVDVEDEPPVEPSGLIRAEAGAAVRGGRRIYGEARADADGRIYLEDGSVIAAERLALEGGLRTERRAALIALGIEGSRYDGSRTPDSSWAARSRLRVGWFPSAGSSFELAGSGGLRRYDEGGQTDATVGASVTAAMRPLRGIWLRAGVSGERRESTRNDPDRFEVAPNAGIELRSEHLEAALAYTLYVRDFDVVDRDGVEHVASAEVAWLAGEALGVFVEGEVGIARGEPSALVYDRVEVLGGILVRFDAGRDAAPEVAAGDAAEPDQGPAQLGGRGVVRFRIRLPGVRSVAVVGTFNQWEERRGALRATGDGWFERTLTVRPGHHRYHLVVDGEPVAPEGAPRYVDDGFGGRDAVLLVP